MILTFSSDAKREFAGARSFKESANPPPSAGFHVAPFQVNRHAPQSSDGQRQRRQRLAHRQRFAPHVDFISVLPMGWSVRRGVQRRGRWVREPFGVPEQGHQLVMKVSVA